MARILLQRTWLQAGPESEDLGIGRFSYPNHGADLQSDAENLTAGSVPYAMISYREPADGEFLTTVHNVLKTGNRLVPLPPHLQFLCRDAAGDYQGVNGAKVWLVPVSDLNVDAENSTAVFTAWTPSSYLFESDLITQTCPAF